MVSSGPALATRGGAAGAVVAAVMLAGAWPLYAAHLERSAEDIGTLRLEIPPPVRGWSLEARPATNWRPNYDETSASVFQTYRKGDRVAILYIGFSLKTIPLASAGAQSS